jgi:hypothetical protein
MLLPALTAHPAYFRAVSFSHDNVVSDAGSCFPGIQWISEMCLSSSFRAGRIAHHGRTEISQSPKDEVADSFIASGFTKEQVLEEIAIVAASTTTNYAGTITNPPLEVPFRRYAWRG